MATSRRRQLLAAADKAAQIAALRGCRLILDPMALIGPHPRPLKPSSENLIAAAPTNRPRHRADGIVLKIPNTLVGAATLGWRSIRVELVAQ